MHKVKSHKSVEEIAKKHRLEVSFVKNQLKMGVPIEHEHTKDKDLATDIALQHLDEIPDYYTRLRKMESSAKKEHKKFKDVKESTDGIGAKSKGYNLERWFDDGGWVQTGGKYDGKPCAKQPGQTTKPYCRDPDDRASMDKDERNKRAAKKRREDPNPNRTGKAKMVTQESAGEKDACYKKVKSRYKVWPSAYASGALVKCRKVGASNWGTKTEEMEMMRYCPKCKKDESRNECKYGPKFWDMYSMPIKLKDYTPNTPHPGNFPESYDHEYSMARSELSTIISAAKRLRKKMKGEGNIEAWVQSKITKAADYLDTAADYVDSGEMKEQVADTNAPIDNPNIARFNTAVKAISKKPQLTDAQKIGAFRQAAQIYRGVREDVTLQDTEGNTFVEIIDIIKPEKLKRTVNEKCWDGYSQSGMKKKGKNLVPNCVKTEQFSNWRKELFEQKGYVMSSASQSGAYSGGSKNAYRVGDTIPVSATKPSLDKKKIEVAGNEYGKKAFQEDWQSVNRKDKTDGLSQAAVDAYRRENPGSKLQTAVTEKNPKGKRAKRRASFCRRMKGHKAKNTSAKTARDPDSRINKALRRWNCN